MKLTTCCWPVRCKAVRNLTHCSSDDWFSDVNTSSRASFLLNTVLSLRTSLACLLVKTSRRRSSLSSPKSGSMNSASEDFSVVMADKILAFSSAAVTTYWQQCIVQCMHLSTISFNWMSLTLITRNPCHRKETARCRSFRFDVRRHSVKFKSSQAPKSRHTGGKKTEIDVKWSFKVMYFGVSAWWKGDKGKIIVYNNAGLIL